MKTTLHQRVKRTKEQLVALEVLDQRSPSDPERDAIRARLTDALDELDAAADQMEAQNEQIASLRDVLERERRHFADLFQRAPVALIVSDPRGVVTEANLAAGALLGVSARRLIGKPMSVYVATEARAELTAHLAGVATKQVEDWNVAIAPRSQAPLSATIDLHPDLGRDGHIEAIRWVIRPSADVVRQAVERHRFVDLMLAGLSHDLRSPLASMIGSVQTLQRYPEAVEAPALLNSVVAGGQSVLAILNDLLDLDRMRRRGVKVRAVRTRIDKLVASTLAHIDAEQRFVVEVGELVAVIDPGIFERITDNLVRNAAKYSPPDGTIWIRAEGSETGLILTVEDEGPGVPEDEKRNIFDAFARGSNAGGRAGSGLGLALVVRFAELHDGEAWVTDRPGGGAAFKVQLRVAVEASE